MSNRLLELQPTAGGIKLQVLGVSGRADSGLRTALLNWGRNLAAGNDRRSANAGGESRVQAGNFTSRLQMQFEPGIVNVPDKRFEVLESVWLGHIAVCAERQRPLNQDFVL